MAQKRKEAYMARLSDILAANMQRVSKEFAARVIQVICSSVIKQGVLYCMERVGILHNNSSFME
jgi:hypothetical protein